MPVRAVGHPDGCSFEFIDDLFEVSRNGKDIDDDFAADHGDDPGALFRAFHKLEGRFVDHIQVPSHPDHAARVLVDDAHKMAVRLRIQLTAVHDMDFFSRIEQIGIHRGNVAPERSVGQVAAFGILPRLAG